MDLREELKSGGVYPTGPCSAWPETRHDYLISKFSSKDTAKNPKIKATGRQMAKSLIENAGRAITGGKVSSEVREERYNICKKCPAFRHEDKRCSECGCFMEVKTWVNSDPKKLCPLKNWSR